MKRNVVFFIIVIGLFVYYESMSLTLMSVRGFDVDSPVLTYVIFALFGVLLLFLLLPNKSKISTNGFEKTFNNLYIYMYVVTILCGFFYPLGSRYYYFEILIPLLLCRSFKVFLVTIDERLIKCAFLALFLVLLYSYVIAYIQRQYLILGNVNKSLSVMNASYFMLYMTPFVLCLKRQIVKVVGLIIIFVCIMMSFKRGALVAFVFSLMAYIFSMLGNSKQQRKSLLVIVLAIIPMYYIVNYFILSGGDFLVERVSSIAEDKGTHRLDIYEDTIGLIFDSNIFSFVFGHGWDSVIRYSNEGFSAHNDFIESFFDFGLIGFILYVFLYVKLYKTYKHMKRLRFSLAAPYLSSIIIFLISSSVSIVLLYPFSLSLFLIFWVYAEVELRKNIKFI